MDGGALVSRLRAMRPAELAAIADVVTLFWARAGDVAADGYEPGAVPGDPGWTEPGRRKPVR